MPSLASQPSVSGVKRVTTMKILGITIGEKLTVTEHVNNILSSCSSSMYALKTLRGRGMPAQALHVVTRATTMARMMYASPAWWGYMEAGDRDRLERFTQRLRSAGFLPGDAPTVDGLASRADDRSEERRVGKE